MGRYKSSVSLNELTWVKGNMYKVKYAYKERTNNRYYYKENCTTCGKEILRDPHNVGRWIKGYCSVKCKSKLKRINMTNSAHFSAHGSLNKCVAYLMKTGVMKYNPSTNIYCTEAE